MHAMSTGSERGHPGREGANDSQAEHADSRPAKATGYKDSQQLQSGPAAWDVGFRLPPWARRLLEKVGAPYGTYG